MAQEQRATSASTSSTRKQPDGGRSPIYDDPNYWDVLARPVKARAEPASLTSSPISTTTPAPPSARSTSTTRRSSTDPRRAACVKVRLIEGFSGEEGVVDMFGPTEFDGQSLLRRDSDQRGRLVRGPGAGQRAGAHAAHRQVRDARIGQTSRHLDQRPRRRAALLRRLPREPHQDDARSRRACRRACCAARSTWTCRAPQPRSSTRLHGYGKVARRAVGPGASSRSSTAKCVTCHDGDASKPGNPSYTVTDMTTDDHRRRSRSTCAATS